MPHLLAKRAEIPMKQHTIILDCVTSFLHDLLHPAPMLATQAEAHGGQIPDLPYGTLLSRFNLWLEVHGKRPTTLPALRTALGMAEVSSPGA